jgi:Tetratricopeptide repeat.
MNKKVFLFTLLGLAVGFFGGFFLANSLNRSMMNQQPATASLNNQQMNLHAAPDQTAGGGAIPMVTEAIERAKNEPENFEAQYNAADMYYRIDRFEEAAKFYEAAHKILPDHYLTIVRLGNSNYGMKRYEEAEKWYAKALELKPDDVDVRTDYGSTFFLRQPRNIDRAVQEYKASLEINPKHEPTLQNLCAAYLEKGDKQSLSDALARLEKVNPQNPTISKFKEELGLQK